jgi:error-prone DNA polymerase
LWQVEAAWSEDEALFKHHAIEEMRILESPGSGDSEFHASGIPHPQSAIRDPQFEEQPSSPLAPMTIAERFSADFSGLELTAGTHPMALIRPQLTDVWRAADLTLGRDGERLTIAGSVICRQRPGTAKGFVFISLEDETGIANAIVVPQLFEARRLVITQEPALRITGKLQNQHGVIHVKADKIEALTETALPAQTSHDFR